MPSRSAAPGARRAAGSGGGRTTSTDAGSGRYRFRGHQDLAVRVDGDLVVLIFRDCLHHDDAAAVLGLVELLGHGPFGRERVARAHCSGEAAMMLEISERGAREVHADRRGDERRGERAVQDARAEHRFPGELLVDVQRVEVAEKPGREHEMRLGHREAGAEALAEGHLVVPLALEHYGSVCFPAHTACTCGSAASARAWMSASMS